jgi:hypothetical membrane protein
MTDHVAAPRTAFPSAPAREATSSRATRWLIACGAAGGPLFMVVALAESFTRPGFDLRRHAISMLSLGDQGWIQVTDFVLSGLLIMAMAVGARRVLRPGRAGTWGPLLIGAYGLGMICAGVFSTDPGLGFPAGAPAGKPTTLSWHAMLHTLGFFLAFTSVTAACALLARRFAGQGQRGWAAYCVGTAVAAPVLIPVGIVSLIPTGVAFAVLGVLTSAWIGAIALRLLGSLSRRPA